MIVAVCAAAIFAVAIAVSPISAQIFSQPITATHPDPLNALDPATRCGAYWGTAMNPPLAPGWYKWNGLGWEPLTAVNCPNLFKTTLPVAPPAAPPPTAPPPVFPPPPPVVYPPPPVYYPVNPPPPVYYPVNPPPVTPPPTTQPPAIPIPTNQAFLDPAIRCGAYWGPTMNPPRPDGWYKWNGTGWYIMTSAITCT